MKFSVRTKSAAVVAAAVFAFGVALPLLSDATITGASGHKTPVGKKSTVGSKSPVKKAPVTTTTAPGTKKPVTTTTAKPVVHTLTVQVTFATTSSTLSAAAKSQLSVFAKKILTGATVTITGYSKKSLSLSNRRATTVEGYLKSTTKSKFSVKTIPALASKNAAFVRVRQS
ncbi:MAG TPA: hypothetical protein VIJ40_10185 [Acidimicrobiales bacterium]